MPELSVAMTVYNAMPYLAAAVESILGQTLRDFEFVILDDGSTDGSEAYLESLADPRVRVHRARHLGLTSAKNRLIDLVHTQYCAMMDADDIALPNRLAEQLAFMRQHDEVVLAGCQIKFIAGDDLVRAAAFPTTHEKILSALLRARPVICHPSCIVRTAALRAVRGYRLRYAEEFDLFLRLTGYGELANLDELLFNYRIHLRSTFTTHYLENKRSAAYAIAAYHARQSGAPEPALVEFLDAWEQCGRL